MELLQIILYGIGIYDLYKIAGFVRKILIQQNPKISSEYTIEVKKPRDRR